MRYLCSEHPTKRFMMLKVKIDTKEIFHVICIEEKELTANMAEILEDIIAKKQLEAEKSLVIDLNEVQSMAPELVKTFVELHNCSYAKRKSMVFCHLQPAVRATMDATGLSDSLNITPTASEAWDIVQMEEIERELDMDI
jgi:anti-anti-sigma factor